ncbi:DUF2062 domain-containing protein [Marinomonas agarivorans]|nr:DUF2062 domain-containing protein [Marinomonas agarivorans]
MPKRYLKRHIPNPEKLKQNKMLSILGDSIHDPELWHLHRHSVARAFLNGLFWCAIPMPLQMLFAALFAIPLRANIPLSLALVWVSNPITMPFVFYINYLIGEFIIGQNSGSEFQLSIEWIWSKLGDIWLPLYLGSLVSGGIMGVMAYFSILGLWRYNVNRRWQERKRKRDNTL